MNIIPGAIPGTLILEPRVFGDARGFFMESYNKRAMAEAGIDAEFVQDNHSRSQRGVLRGLHYQIKRPQGKLVRVATGAVFAVVVDLRRTSPDFGRTMSLELTAENRRMLWIPPGLANGFLVLSEYADYLYKTSDYYAPEFERCIAWNDPQLAIPWPLDEVPTLAEKDARGVLFRDAEVFP